MRQPLAVDPSVRTLAADYPKGGQLGEHAHGWHQLIYASTGVLTVETDDGYWVMPCHRALWVPAGYAHRLSSTRPFALRTIFLERSQALAMPDRCCVVCVPPLLREVILQLVAIGLPNLDRPQHARLLGVLLDLLDEIPQEPLVLPQPRHAQARRIADLLRANPGDQRTLSELAGAVGASKRTLERRFATETGMSFRVWRQQARLLQALRLLADGVTVVNVAYSVGYESPSAFVAMFRRALGITPKRYFDGAAKPRRSRQPASV